MLGLWFRTLLTLLAIALGVFLPLWLIFDLQPAFGAVAAILALLILVHVFYLGRLLRWANGPVDAPVPTGPGVWDLVFAGLHRRSRHRREQQRSLGEALERFRSAIQALPDGIIVFNRTRQIDWINTQAEAQFLLDAAVDRGQVLTNLLRVPEFINYLDSGHYSEALVLDNPRNRGQTLWLRVIPYAEGETLLLSRDISQQERLERMRRDFVANVSHELKTPLTVVAGFAEMLGDQDELDSATTRHYMHLISEQAARMQNLISDLLTLSSLETTQTIEHEEWVEVEPLLQAIKADTEVLSGSRHQVNLTIEGIKRVRGCPGELRSAFANLASNAVRYTPEGGHIDLAWHADAGGGHFSVTDTGIGIASQHLPRLTERFYRVDRGRSRGTGGTGLGLAIVKHILNRHQGNLSIASEVGKGSCFTAHLPARRLEP